MLSRRAIPKEILEAAPESPYVFPREAMRRRAEAALERDPTPSTRVALDSLPVGGTVLDVGVGSGAASFPLGSKASLIVGVDSSTDLLKEFQDLGLRAGVETRAVVGVWQKVAAEVEPADVVVCHHVLYNVAEIEPFVRALSESARRRVVVEMTNNHPLAWMDDLWMRFHDVDFPSGPTSSDAIDALREMDIDFETAEWRLLPGGGFEHRREAIAFVRRRLCIGPDRDAEIADALGERLISTKGSWRAGPHQQTLTTMWWDPT